MVRILYLTDQISDNSPTSQSMFVANHFAEQGVTVKLITLTAPTPRQAEIGWVDHIETRNTSIFSRARELVQRVKDFQPDVIHAWGDRAAESLAWLPKLVGRPATIFSHTRYDISTRLSGSMLLRIGLRSAGLHLVPDPILGNRIDKSGRMNVETIGWGWPVQQRLHDPRLDEVASHTDDADRQKQVATFLPFEPESRIKDVIWAAELVTCTRSDVDWLVVGNGSQAWRLKRYAGQQGIGPNIRFLDWDQFSEKAWKHVDVLVQPSPAYTDFNSIMCAMSHGIPVVAANHELTGKLVTSGKTGFLVEYGARNEIARCATRLINRPDIAKRFGIASQERLKSEFPFSSVTDSLEEIYKREAQRRRTRQVA